jgi:hypothetical protein
LNSLSEILKQWCIILFLPSIALSQEPYIFSNDKYSGISVVGISPTQPFLNPNGWDAHLFSEDIFAQNRYIYISETSVLGLLNGDDIDSANPSEGITGENTARVSDYFNYDITGYHFSNDLMGPSVSLNFTLLNRDFSAGLFTRLRTQSSVIEADNYLQYTNQEIDEPVLYNLSPFKFNFMNWGEIGLNLSTKIFDYSENVWIIGGNLKYLMGLDAVFVNNKEDALMRRTYEPDVGPPDNPENPEPSNVKTLYINDFDIDVGYATNYNFDSDVYEFNIRGNGIGVDLGTAMLIPKYKSNDYDLKISLNLLDLGYVNFTGNVHNFKGEELKYVNNVVLDEAEFENPEQYAQLISNEIYGNQNQSLVAHQFKIGLPTSVHINASKNIGENQFVNLDWIQRAPLFEYSLKRSNIVNVSYSYQKEKFGSGASISMYEYRNFQVGGFLRYGPLLIGSENLFPFFINHKKLHGMDFYIGLKLYPFWENEMTRKSREKCWCDD